MKTKSRIYIYSLIIMGFVLILENSCRKKEINNDKITDADGNVYTFVTIGIQIWMAENLKTTKYNDGLNIPNVTDNIQWNSLSTPAYCWYNNDASAYKTTFGALYNWHAASSGKLCPTGWHVPSDDEWTTLVINLGGENVAGGKLKEVGTLHWLTPNTGATNETGFTALPGGTRYLNGAFDAIGRDGFWWVSTERDANLALYRYMYFNYSGVGRSNYGTHKNVGLSVRCIKDNLASVNQTKYFHLKQNLTLDLPRLNFDN